MWWARVLIFGFPLAALCVGSWSAWQAQAIRRPSAEEVTVMLPGGLPALNPFRPMDEAERQMLDLIHEPLLRIGRDGRLSPALAARWQWRRNVTCWFRSPDIAQQASRRLQALSGNQWVAAQLESAIADGNAVTMRFLKPDGAGPDEGLRSIADLQPLPLSLIQIPGGDAMPALLKDFVAAHGDVIKRLWFDRNGTGEVVATIPGLQLQQILTPWLQARKHPAIVVRPVGEVTGLVEPILYFHLRPQAQWHDGSPVTVEDIRATVDWVQTKTAAGAGFQDIQSMVKEGQDSVRIAYRSGRGAALASWLNLPILPAAWLKAHAEPWAEPPPGAGAFRLLTRDPQSLTLESSAAPIKRVRFVVASPPLKTDVGLRTRALDVLWPGPLNESELRSNKNLDFQAAPPRNRLLVLWNVRSPVLSDSRVREALALATDRPALIHELLEGRGRLVEGAFPPGVWYNQQSSAQMPDLAAAERKLAEAGWLRDVQGVAKTSQRTLDFELLITAGNPWRERLAQALARQWARVGARVTVKAVDPQDLVSARLDPGRFDAVLLGMDLESTWDQSHLWHSGLTKGSMNFSGLADPQLDLLLDALAAEYNPDQIAMRAKAMEDRLLSLQAAVPLFSDLQQVALRRDRFPTIPVRPAGLMLRDLLQPVASPEKAPVKPKMIMPDE